MAYAVESGSRRFIGSGGVVAVHVTLAYLLVFGLAAPEFIKQKENDVIAVNVKPTVEPPPPEENTRPQPETPVETKVHTPDPPIDLTALDPVKSDPPLDKSPPIVFVPQQPTVINEPIEANLFTPTLAKPINNVLRWVTTSDYPRISIRREEQGVAGFRVQVDARGNATGCSITRSSGSTALDEATCRNVMKRARFEPATDKFGARVPGTYSNSVNWVLPE